MVVKTLEIQGVPVCLSYKYLGTYLEPKLDLKHQIRHITTKAAHIFTKLYPYLKSASADARRDAFQTFILPLFKACYIVLAHEPSKSHFNNLERLRRVLFKQFLMISKRTPTLLVNILMNRDLVAQTNSEALIADNKWDARKNRARVRRSLELRPLNPIRGMPNTLCTLINTLVEPCSFCRNSPLRQHPLESQVATRGHLRLAHNIILPEPTDVINFQLKPIANAWVKTSKGKSRQISRLEILMRANPIIQRHLFDFWTCMRN